MSEILFILFLFFRVCATRLLGAVNLAEAAIYITMILIYGLYRLLELANEFSAREKSLEITQPKQDDSIKKDLEEIRSQVNAMNLKQGFKLG